MNIKFPYQFDHTLRTATVNEDAHIRDMIWQVLFTNPGERVNRPDFGCGLLQLVFEPLSDELAATTKFLVQGSLIQWLSDLIEVADVQVEVIDSTLQITVIYKNLNTQEMKRAVFTSA